MIFKFLKPKALPPVMKMLVPGRRALSEEWREVTVRPNPAGGYDIENEEAQAPALRQPIFIPALANLSNEECNFILEGARKAQEYEAKRPKRRPVSDAEIQKMANQMWRDYLEQKILAYKGTSQFGPSGMTQRQSFEGPKEFNPKGW